MSWHRHWIFWTDSTMERLKETAIIHLQTMATANEPLGLLRDVTTPGVTRRPSRVTSLSDTMALLCVRSQSPMDSQFLHTLLGARLRYT